MTLSCSNKISYHFLHTRNNVFLQLQQTVEEKRDISHNDESTLVVFIFRFFNLWGFSLLPSPDYSSNPFEDLITSRDAL